MGWDWLQTDAIRRLGEGESGRCATTRSARRTPMTKTTRLIGHDKATTSLITIGRNDDIDFCHLVTISVVTRMRSRVDAALTKHRYHIASCRLHSRDI